MFGRPASLSNCLKLLIKFLGSIGNEKKFDQQLVIFQTALKEKSSLVGVSLRNGIKKPFYDDFLVEIEAIAWVPE